MTSTTLRVSALLDRIARQRSFDRLRMTVWLRFRFAKQLLDVGLDYAAAGGKSE